MRSSYGPGRSGNGWRTRRAGLARPRLYVASFLCLPFVILAFCQGTLGSRRGDPTITARARSGYIGSGYLEKPAAAMAFRAVLACSGL